MLVYGKAGFVDVDNVLDGYRDCQAALGEDLALLLILPDLL